MRRLIIILLSFHLVACATLSEEECVRGNWWLVGYKDGTKGYDSSRLEEHAQACKDYSKPDRNRYMAGRQIGLTYHCAESRAYKTNDTAIIADKGDWRAIGEDHGLYGEVFDVERYRHNCAQFNITMNEDAYRQGYRRGVDQYCAPDSAFKIGRAAEHYHYGVCGPYEKAFLKEYVRGLDAAESKLDHSISHTNNELSSALSEFNYAKDEKKRHKLQSHIDKLQNEIEGLNKERSRFRGLRRQALDAL